ncbi:tRNA pseudouridine(38-40) synthase TruA [Desulfogranum mediterraneum]|uniref:tRNA pseudouridine(38-40) synthase TruA n=1 Tax=Desulfogranum mediterraneum TaxID=160661 RepID=UPI00041B8BFA|nr:tRNA pseudouridine(38-40) synthase TruA [Desulfogranum mediterraneum]
MSRLIRLLISYDGSGYHGWQRQHNGITVQEVVEEQLAVICRHPVALHGAGRTDAGVHALGMVAHFQTSTSIPVQAFSRGLNSMLPRDIRILAAQTEQPDFHSRFSALGKTYRYDFFCGEVQLPMSRKYCAHYPGAFESERIQPAIEALIGSHDFASFERSGSRDPSRTGGRGAVRTLYQLSCTPQLGRPEHWSIRVSGDGFLRQMVRIIAGTLIQIGCSRREPDSMAAVIAARDRTAAGMTAPACGLYLEKIYYHHLFDH